MKSSNALSVDVQSEAEITVIEFEPKSPSVGVGETVPLRVLACVGMGSNRKSLGDISSRGDLVGKANNRK